MVTRNSSGEICERIMRRGRGKEEGRKREKERKREIGEEREKGEGEGGRGRKGRVCILYDVSIRYTLDLLDVRLHRVPLGLG